MKIMIASDLHGSAAACRELLVRFEQEKAEQLVLLGDLLYHGPRNDLTQEYDPKQVAEMLNQQKDKIICVRGNCDTEADQSMLEFSIMAEYAILYEQEKVIFVTHGHRFHQGNTLILQDGDVLLHGHTHVPANETITHYRYLNPGSVALPRAGSRAGYMTLEDGVFTWKTLDGEIYDQWKMM